MVLRRISLACILFLLPWLIMAALPGLRLPLLIVVQRDLRVWVGGLGLPVFYRSAPFEVESASVLDPIEVQAVSGVDKMSAEKELFRLAALSDRYPKEPWLITGALLSMPIADGRLRYQMPVPFQPRKEFKPAENYFTPALIRKAFDLCARGEKLEPDNGFYDWMRARLLVVQQRDAEAVRAIEASLRHPLFHQHSRDWVHANLVAVQQKRPLLAEEKTLVIMQPLQQDYSFHTTRGVAEVLAMYVRRLEGQQRHQEAIRTVRALTHMSMAQMHAAHFHQQGMAGEYMLNAAWTAGQRDTELFPVNRLTSKMPTEDEKSRIAAERFITYAEQHGVKVRAETEAQLRVLTGFRLNPGDTKTHFRSSVLYPRYNPHLAGILFSWVSTSVFVGCVVLNLVVAVGLLLAGPNPSSAIQPQAKRSLPRRSVMYPLVIGWGGSVILFALTAWPLMDMLRNDVSSSSFMHDYIGGFLGSAVVLPAILVLIVGVGTSFWENRRVVVAPRWNPSLVELGIPSRLEPAVISAWRILRVLVWVTVVLLPVWLLGVLVYRLFVNHRGVKVQFRPALRVVRSNAWWSAVVFSWLTLAAMGMAVPLRTEVERELNQFLASDAKRAVLPQSALRNGNAWYSDRQSP